MTHARIILLIGALATLHAPDATAQSSTASKTPLEGVWNYVAPRHGQSLFLGNSYVMFNTRPDSAATSSPPSDADQARLYRTLSLQSGTFTVADTIVTMNETFSKNPRQGPVTWRWSYSLKGDTMTWRVLGADGRVTNSGISVRAHGSR